MKSSPVASLSPLRTWRLWRRPSPGLLLVLAFASDGHGLEPWSEAPHDGDPAMGLLENWVESHKRPTTAAEVRKGAGRGSLSYREGLLDLVRQPAALKIPLLRLELARALRVEMPSGDQRVVVALTKLLRYPRIEDEPSPPEPTLEDYARETAAMALARSTDILALRVLDVLALSPDKPEIAHTSAMALGKLTPRISRTKPLGALTKESTRRLWKRLERGEIAVTEELSRRVRLLENEGGERPSVATVQTWLASPHKEIRLRAARGAAAALEEAGRNQEGRAHLLGIVNERYRIEPNPQIRRELVRGLGAGTAPSSVHSSLWLALDLDIDPECRRIARQALDKRPHLASSRTIFDSLRTKI